ncbi:uncharacterized protein IWZ02DRAFT_379450 [Phyllosticta citriasiana]|uniref:Uncharacterized protein n=1 Tax=Phyllosticta citriasiana TaxID=595635 RepID=A0ABR1KMD7_9PEZI
MAATPPLLERISTPPAPARGPQSDDWEPYRRSRRVAAQRDRHLQDLQTRPSASPQKSTASSARASTPLGRRTSPHSSQTISPPSSPRSPIKRTTTSASNSDADPFTTSPKEKSSSLTAGPILPTPAKTPGKRKVSQAAFGSTARVLFHDRPATIDEVMPPKTARKKKRAGFSLASFSESFECDESSKIEIYTDGKERVPSYSKEEDNPFVTQPGEARRPKPGPSSKKPKSDRDENMERRARNGEGLIHVFRGKKFFSEFTDHDSDVDEAESPLGGSPVRRIAASSTAPRRLLRSSIKPRLLWPNEEQQAAREHSSKSGEEDSTDIEAPFKVNSGTHYQVSRGHGPTFHEEASPTVPQQGIPTPFDAWRRTKSGSGSTAKREGELLEATGAKRTRSATHAHASRSTQ